MWSSKFSASLFLFFFVSIQICDGDRRSKMDEHFTTKSNTSANNREKKLLNLFTIIRFRNNPCVGNNNLNGTCYAAAECSQRGGTNSGSCAAGYGVCCTFTLGCGGTSSENCTYFASTGSEVGQCSITICPCNNNICQLRLDFNTFVITGPSTSSATVGTALNGVLTTGAGAPVAVSGQCLTDTFSVTSPGNQAPPVICGTNTGEHMYVDAADTCNTLDFQLGNAAVGTTLATRSWNIKVTQYSCDYENLAPSGCTQYFFGSTSQTVQTYNFNNANGGQLANQDQNICVRRERGNCRICWTTMAATDFALSGTTGKMGLTVSTACCAYGADGAMVNGFDCVVIPGASKNTINSAMLPAGSFCGRGGLATINTMAMATVCTRSQPFNLRFLSDQYEFTAAIGEAKTADAGFRLTYIQTAC